MSIRLYTFQAQCMFDQKRWRRVVRCATADRGPNLDSFKKVMLDACDVVNDE